MQPYSSDEDSFRIESIQYYNLLRTTVQRSLPYLGSIINHSRTEAGLKASSSEEKVLGSWIWLRTLLSNVSGRMKIMRYRFQHFSINKISVPMYITKFHKPADSTYKQKCFYIGEISSTVTQTV